MRLDVAARTAIPVLVCALINVAAYLQAKGFSALVDAALMSGAPTSGPAARLGSARTASQREGSEHVSDARPLFDRNVFDSSFGRVPGEALRAKSAAEPPCEGLHASLIALGDDPSWSFASLAAPGAPQLLRRIGDELSGRTVLAIQRDRVVLGAGELVCEVKLGRAPVSRPASPAPEATAPTPLGVERVGKDRLVVHRAQIASLLADPAAALGQVRVRPTPGGLKVMGVRPGSPLAALGLENGDVLQSLGGAELHDPAASLRALMTLSSSSTVDVALARHGVAKTIRVDIVE